MQEYVVINAMCRNPANKDAVLLVLKNRPAWQAGFFNLIGGKVEPGEYHKDAAHRELFEETGLEGQEVWLTGKIQCPDALIYCYNARVDESVSLSPQEGETEKVAWFQWQEVVFDKRLMPNLRVIIPLMRSNVWDWTVNATTNSLGEEYHTVTVTLTSSANVCHHEMFTVNSVLAGEDIIVRN